MVEAVDSVGVGAGRVLSLAPLTVLELGPEELVDAAAGAGFDAVGLRLIRATPQEPRRPTVGMTPLVRDIKRRLDNSGLQLIDIEVLRLRPETQIREDFGTFLETGAFLGAQQIVVTGNDPDHSRTADRFAELAELSAEYDMTPSLEPMPWTEVRNLEEAAAIVARSGHHNVGLLVDAIHYDRALNTPADLAALPRNWIRYAQICDAVAERPDSVDELIYQGRVARLFPGQGSIDLVSMLRALPANIPISVEAPVLWDAPASVRARAAQRAARTVLEMVDGDDHYSRVRYA